MAVNKTFIGNIKGKQGEKGATGAKLVSQVLQGQDENGGYIYLQTYDDGTLQPLLLLGVDKAKWVMLVLMVSLPK